MAILSWLATRWGLSALQALLNPIILALLFGGVALGGMVGWTKASQHYQNDSRIAQLESQLATAKAEYSSLADAAAATSAQLNAATVKQSKTDATIAEYDAKLNADRITAAKVATQTGKAPVCNDMVNADLLNRLRANQ